MDKKRWNIEIFHLFFLNGLLIVLSAQTPKFSDPIYIKSNSTNINVGHYGAPFVYDWDGDGKKDLLIGESSSGKIRFYRNIGTNNNPIFGDYSLILADGKEITLSYGCCGGTAIAVCDWNEDGMRDLISGEKTGYLTLFLETGSGLTNAGHIQANGKDIQVKYNSSPCVCDWDEDGKKDLIVGEQYAVPPNTGNIRLYLNRGTNSAPVFKNYIVLRASGKQINRYRVNPRIYDLDQDGLKDLILGENDGCVYFYKNIGSNIHPVYSAQYEALKTVNDAIINVHYGSRFDIIDWTLDGDPDLLISGFDGYIQLYENIPISPKSNSLKFTLFLVLRYFMWVILRSSLPTIK